MIYRTTEPAVEPVTLSEAKAHLRIDLADDDALVAAIISAARDAVERYCIFASADFVETFDSVNGSIIQLSHPDISSVTSVAYTDGADSEQTVSTGITLDAIFSRVTLSSAITGARAKVLFSAGPDVLPPSIRQAILLTITDMYENRGSQQWQALYVNRAAESLMHSYRVSLGV
jgi:uncharacterized phiE125 gp8 family phage protein